MEYSDCSRTSLEGSDKPKEDMKTSTTATEIVTAQATSRNPKNHNFPARMHFILTETEKDGLSHIVSWQPHGRAFKVHKPNEFVNQVLRRWFRQNKLTSFHRQLNIYGFTRFTSGPDKHGYYHERFLRGQLHLTYDIPRMYVKGTGSRRSTSTTKHDPNFYAMPFLPGLSLTVADTGSTNPDPSSAMVRTVRNRGTAASAVNCADGVSLLSMVCLDMAQLPTSLATSSLGNETQSTSLSRRDNLTTTTIGAMPPMCRASAIRMPSELRSFVGGSHSLQLSATLHTRDLSPPILQPSNQALTTLSSRALLAALQSITANCRGPVYAGASAGPIEMMSTNGLRASHRPLVQPNLTQPLQLDCDIIDAAYLRMLHYDFATRNHRNAK